MYRELLALLLLNAGRALIMGTQHMRRYVCRQQLVPATNRRMASLVARGWCGHPVYLPLKKTPHESKVQFSRLCVCTLDSRKENKI